MRRRKIVLSLLLLLSVPLPPPSFFLMKHLVKWNSLSRLKVLAWAAVTQIILDKVNLPFRPQHTIDSSDASRRAQSSFRRTHTNPEPVLSLTCPRSSPKPSPYLSRTAVRPLVWSCFCVGPSPTRRFPHGESEARELERKGPTTSGKDACSALRRFRCLLVNSWGPGASAWLSKKINGGG